MLNTRINWLIVGILFIFLTAPFKINAAYNITCIVKDSVSGKAISGANVVMKEESWIRDGVGNDERILVAAETDSAGTTTFNSEYFSDRTNAEISKDGYTSKLYVGIEEFRGFEQFDTIMVLMSPIDSSETHKVTGHVTWTGTHYTLGAGEVVAISPPCSLEIRRKGIYKIYKGVLGSNQNYAMLIRLADSGWFSFTATKYNFLDLGRYLTWLGYAATYCKVVKDTILDLDFIHDGSAAEQINVANNNILSSSPNPFNPATNFYLRLPEETFVTMKIFDTQGRIVKVLRNGKMHKGQNIVRWNAENVPFGVYYVVLTVGNIRYVSKTVRTM